MTDEEVKEFARLVSKGATVAVSQDVYDEVAKLRRLPLFSMLGDVPIQICQWLPNGTVAAIAKVPGPWENDL